MSTLLYSTLTMRREQTPPPDELASMRREAQEARLKAFEAATGDQPQAQAQALAVEAVAKTEKSATAEAEKPTDFVDIVAALIPAEVIAVHALILGNLSTKTEDASGAVVTRLDPAHADLERIAWIGLVVAAALLYLVGHLVAGREAKRSFDGLDVLRMLIPAAAFWIWTMIQQGTLFDAVWDWPIGIRSVIGGLGALALLAAAKVLSYEADEAAPTSA